MEEDSKSAVPPRISPIISSPTTSLHSRSSSRSPVRYVTDETLLKSPIVTNSASFHDSSEEEPVIGT